MSASTQTQHTLRLLESSNNKKGDLFTRLKGDLFYALGYDDLQFDVPKAGREVDIIGHHRTEQRLLVVECKAHVAKMGGADLNKFYGVADGERDEHDPKPVSAYFVSLGGFTQPAIEQESKRKPHKSIILVDSAKIIKELINARIVVSQATASEKAGQCAQHSGLKDGVLDGVELLGHEIGYLWVIYYGRGKQRSHFALIHADGTPLAATVAQKIIDADKSCNGSLQQYSYLAPEPPQSDKIELEKQALAQYQKWVNTECGDIQLDGMPADADLSAYKLKLERLFVPLKVEVKTKDKDHKSTTEIWPVGQFFTEQPRFSLLAKPGGGKSTLLKRLAVAYVDPERFEAVDDHLPKQTLLPLLLRCRELKERAHNPIRALLQGISQTASMDETQSSAFTRHIDQKLKTGQVLLLIDGLDEITDESGRTAFAANLRSFLAMFPQVAMIATSREAGYRQIAGVIAGSCAQVTMAAFDKEDVAHLCESWHVEVVGDKSAVRADALALAKTIWDNDRIRPLAENPLMLTTLLVIRRCIGGELPTRRVELYGQAVDVLIRTWNTEGYAKMDLDEALVQLSFVACAMMKKGIQQVGYKQLVKWLQQARKELDVELGYTKLSPQQFIERIEYRSSLLMQTGHAVIDGETQAVYEFRHLTFQEYLAARGLVEKQYPGWTDEQSLLDVLEPHIEDKQFREVIPLTAVLAKRKAGPLIARLTKVLAGLGRDYMSPTFNLLLQCLLDEVQISSEEVKQAIGQITRHWFKDTDKDMVVRLLQGRFGVVTIKVIESSFFDVKIIWEDYLVLFNILACKDLLIDRLHINDSYQHIAADLTSTDIVTQCKATLLCMSISHGDKSKFKREQFLELQQMLANLIFSNVRQVKLCAALGLIWCGDCKDWDYLPSVELLMRLLDLYSTNQITETARFAGIAFVAQPLLSREVLSIKEKDTCRQHFDFLSEKTKYYNNVKAILTWYKCFKSSDAELLEIVTYYDKIEHQRLHQMAELLEKSIAGAAEEKA
ncbi:MAG: NACHT domain-containing protein [Algicola sp.]|nr:NACHT domain-containing protein [Algicola sp.]